MAKTKTRKAKDEFILKTPLSFNDLVQVHSDIAPTFNDAWELGRENERYMRGKHWRDDQEAEIRGQNRLPYSFTLIASKINTIVATQANTRTSFRVEAAQNPDDEIKAEVCNMAVKDFERRTDFRYLESEVFKSGVGVQYGACEVYTDYDEDYNRVVMVKPLDYSDVVWDVNSTQYDFSDVLFTAKRRTVYRKMLREEYGDIADHVPPGDEQIGFDRKNLSYFIKADESGNIDYDRLTILYHYHVVEREVWCVFFDDVLNLSGHAGDVIAGKYRSKAEADDALRAMSLPYLIRGIRPKDGDIVMHKEKKLDKYVFCWVGILEYEETDLNPEDCPIKIYRAFQLYDHWWTLTDLLKDPQKFLDRTMAQIDYSLGTDVKNVYQMNINSLADNETASSAQKKLTKTGGIIMTKGNMQSPITPIQSKGANNQYFELASIMQSFVEDLAGGRSFSGLKDQGEESGKAIAEKRAQGPHIAELLIDNLIRWKMNLGRTVIEWMKRFEDAQRTIKVAGSSLTPQMRQILQLNGIYSPSATQPKQGYININQEGNEQSYLKGAKYTLLITEGELTETDADSKIAQIEKVSKLTNTPAPLELILNYVDMDESLKTKWMQIQEQQQKMQQALLKDKIDKEQQKLDTQKANVLTKTLPKETITHNVEPSGQEK